MSTPRKHLILALVCALATLGMIVLAAPGPSGAQPPHTHGHFLGGNINIGDGTIEVGLDCDVESFELDPSFQLLVDGSFAYSDEMHCHNIEASGPLGDAEIDFLCEFWWWPWTGEWPTMTLHISCLMHVTLLDQPFPPPTDALCGIHVDHWMPANEENNGGLGPFLWLDSNATTLFDPVEEAEGCPEPLPAAIDYFIDLGTAVLLHFFFTPSA
jgi:hypothetical protein